MGTPEWLCVADRIAMKSPLPCQIATREVNVPLVESRSQERGGVLFFELGEDIVWREVLVATLFDCIKKLVLLGVCRSGTRVVLDRGDFIARGGGRCARCRCGVYRGIDKQYRHLTPNDPATTTRSVVSPKWGKRRPDAVGKRRKPSPGYQTAYSAIRRGTPHSPPGEAFVY